MASVNPASGSRATSVGGQRLRVLGGRGVQAGQLTARVGQHHAERHLGRVPDVEHAQRVPDLRLPRDPPVLRAAPGRPHAVDVAVDPVDGHAVDGEPRAAVDPRPPVAGPGHRRVGPGELAGQRGEPVDVERRPVVDAKVDVGVGVVRAAGPAAAQQHADDTPDPDEPPGDRREISHGPTLAGPTGQTRSLRPTTPTTTPSLTTGSSRSPRSAIRSRAAPTVASTSTVIGACVITSPTVRRGPCV